MVEMSTQKRRLTGYFSQEDSDKLEEIAKSEDRSISYVITKMVEEQLRQREDESEDKKSDD